MNILPRFANNSVAQYSSTQHIADNQPELLDPKVGELRAAIEGRQANLAISGEESTIGRRTSAKKKPVIDFQLMAPNVSLTGHEDEVLGCQFSSCGSKLISGGMDRVILYWDLAKECKNTGVFGPLKAPITDIRFSGDDGRIYAGCSDGSTHCFDVSTGQKVRRFLGEGKVVNSIDVSKKGEEIVAASSNDGTIRLFDCRQKDPVHTLKESFPVLSVSFPFDHASLCTGGLDNKIRIWDLRLGEVSRIFEGHSDSISSLSLSHEGSFLLSNSFDNTLKVWDVRPGSTSNLPLKTYTGHTHGPEKNLIRGSFNFNGQLVCCGSADGKVRIWDASKRSVILTLGGHEGSANQVACSPKRDMIASCSTDKTVLVSELPIVY
jgi:Prp8 binding protein